MNDPIIVFDLECDSTRIDCQITQIAAAAYAGGKQLGDFEIKLKFDVSKADPQALEITGYSDARWATAVDPEVACRQFAKWLNPYKCVEKISKKSGKSYKIARGAGYNAAVFDAPRLQALYQAHDIFLPMGYDVLDVLQLARWFFFLWDGPQPENMQLSTVCKFFDIPIINAHDALADVVATASLARELCQRLDVINCWLPGEPLPLDPDRIFTSATSLSDKFNDALRNLP